MRLVASSKGSEKGQHALMANVGKHDGCQGLPWALTMMVEAKALASTGEKDKKKGA